MSPLLVTQASSPAVPQTFSLPRDKNNGPSEFRARFAD